MSTEGVGLCVIVGLAALCVGVGALAGWPWGLVVLGCICLVLATAGAIERGNR